MADSLRINTLGRFEARLPSGEMLALPTRKTETLLAYLALRPGPHSRDHLANVLWSDRGEPQARNSLRQALNSLKKLFAGIEPCPLQINNKHVNLASRLLDAEAGDRAWDARGWRNYWESKFNFKHPQQLDHLLDGLSKAGLVDSNPD